MAHKGDDEKDIYAIKEIVTPSSAITGKKMREAAQREIAELREINEEKSPYILQLYDVISTPFAFYLVMEYCEKGDLKNFLKNRELTPTEAFYEFSQILEGFKVLRKFKKIHRDVKPENILVKDNVLKIADFQSAKTHIQEENNTIGIGTPIYMAPELIEGNGTN